MKDHTQQDVSSEGAVRRPLLWLLIGSCLLAASCSGGSDAGDPVPSDATLWGQFSWGEANWS